MNFHKEDLDMKRVLEAQMRSRTAVRRMVLQMAAIKISDVDGWLATPVGESLANSQQGFRSYLAIGRIFSR